MKIVEVLGGPLDGEQIEVDDMAYTVCVSVPQPVTPSTFTAASTTPAPPTHVLPIVVHGMRFYAMWDRCTTCNNYPKGIPPWD